MTAHIDRQRGKSPQGDHQTGHNRLQLHALAAFCCCVALVTALSFYPFKFREVGVEPALENWVQSLDSYQWITSDIAVNFAIGVLLGSLLGTAILPGFQSTVIRSALVIPLLLICGLISSGIEIAQSCFVGRVSSAIDSLSHTMGAFAGLLCAFLLGQWAIARAALVLDGVHLSRKHRLLACLDLYVFGYIGWMLVPFIPAISPSELKTQLKTVIAEWHALTSWAFSLSENWRNLGAAAISALPVGVWYGIRNTKHRNLFSNRWILIGGLIGLESAQLVIDSRVPSISDAVFSSFGAAVGLALSPLAARLNLFRTRPRILLGIALSASIVYVTISLPSLEIISDRTILLERWNRFWNPQFVSTRSGNDLRVSTNYFRLLIVSVVLGGCFALPATRLAKTPSTVCIFAAGVSVVLVSEIVQIAFLSATPSVVACCVRLVAFLIGFALLKRITHSGKNRVLVGKGQEENGQ